MILAVDSIHTMGIVHRDLKPGTSFSFHNLCNIDNILVGDFNDLTSIKLADFGLSAKYDHVSFKTLDQHCGTLKYMAPEVALKKEYSKNVDIWSIGIIMFMLLTGGSHPLFTNQDTAITYKEKLKNASVLHYPSHISQ